MQEEVKEQEQEQVKQDKNTDADEENVEMRAGEESNAAMPNKTDEQKTEEEQERQEVKELQTVDRQEPIYENISSSISIQQVDNDQAAITMLTRRSQRRSIPNKSNNNNNNNNEHNQTNNNNNNNNKNNNSNNQIDTTTTTTIIAATTSADLEPYYQVPKATEPYYDAPKHLRPIPVYENIDVFYTGLELGHSVASMAPALEPPKEKPPPPPIEPPTDIAAAADDELDAGTWSSDNTYETISSNTRRQLQSQAGQGTPIAQPSPPIKRMNSTKRIKKELRNKRSSFLGIETDADLDDVDSYLELTVAPPPDMAQLLQEERRLEKQLYIKAALCDSSDTGESRDSGVSENHSRQSSEHYTNSSEENDTQSEATPPPMPPPPTQSLVPSQHGDVIYQNETLHAAQTPLLQTVKGNSAESWTESATAAAAATQSLSEATATANAKMLSIEEKIREQGEVLRVERELLQFSQEELKRQRENLLLRENLARRELQHGAKMLMSNNRRSLQDLHHGLGIGNGMLSAFQPPQPQLPHPQQQSVQQIYANVPQQQQQQQQRPAPPMPQALSQYHYQQLDTDYRKSMSDLNEFSKRLMLPPPTPPTKPLRAMHLTTNGHGLEPDYAVSMRQRNGVNSNAYGGSLVKIAGAPMPAAAGGAVPAPRLTANLAAAYHHQSAQNLSNMSRNTLLALSATPKPKYTDGWVQVQQQQQQQRNLANDAAWLQKRKSMPDYNGALYNNGHANHWLLQEAEHRRLLEQQQQQQQLQLNRRSMPVAPSNGKPLPDSIIQTLTERVQSKGIGERKRFDGNGNYSLLNSNGINGIKPLGNNNNNNNSNSNNSSNNSNSNITASSNQDKVLSVSGKKKCSHCGDELDLGCTHDNCRQVHKALKYIVWV
ncbi:GH19501 [Drosophila grimshawi]|uniref:GH19501 n=1 Tax=Drosophila grimshawi TaxID=7222 RepID=B4JGX2_DROGR|nr:GH19501 [Drosophila grimshawi]